MRIKTLSIQNFRSIVDQTVSLDETTIFIGPNNSGKSAILEGLRIALSRRWGQKGTGFTENDIHLAGPDVDIREAPPICIHLALEETTANEWPEDMIANLDEIVTQTDEGLNRVSIAIKYSWNADDELFEPTWEFLNPAGDVLSQKRRSINLSGFYNYILFYWMGALRDAQDEFNSRSRHWGGLLKSMNIPADVEKAIMMTLDELDAKLLQADPRFEEVAAIIGNATEISAGDTLGAARIRMLPLNLWDLLARAGIVIRKEEALPWLPLDHHGQGLQSLAVIFLLQAAVSHALADELDEGAEAIFAIEEPEAHLHPQAARTLWQRISKLPGQKIVTTHSPYFVQHVPLHNLRIVRLKNCLTTVVSLKKRVLSKLPWSQEVENLVKGKGINCFQKDPKTNLVTSNAWFDENIADELANCWKGSKDKKQDVDAFRHESRLLVSVEDENDLAILGRRMRGEIFFAKKWILVEGQCEYLLLHAIGSAFGYDLDQHGISVIDFQNNGSPAIYAGLADAFEFPWIMITDGDPAGEGFIKQLKKRGFDDADLKNHVNTLTTPNDLEDQLIADGHEQLLREILAELSGADAKTCSLEDFKKRLKNKKIPYMTKLAPIVASDKALASKMPSLFLKGIEKLKGGNL